MRYLIFGDSITEGAFDSEGGWADRVKRSILRKMPQAQVFNLGVSGARTAHVIERFESESRPRTKQWSSDEPNTVIFAIGVNDSAAENRPDNFKESLEGFAKNVKLLQALAAAHVTKIYWLQIANVDESRTNPTQDDSVYYVNQRIAQFNEVIKAVSGDAFLTLEPLAASELYDGLHPNSLGHEKIAAQVFRQLLI